jgi:hypothetical protein
MANFLTQNTPNTQAHTPNQGGSGEFYYSKMDSLSIDISNGLNHDNMKNFHIFMDKQRTKNYSTY